MVATVFEFGDFKLDCDRFELYRAGRSLKLKRKPMELLILLATRNGHLVSRTEIAERLWAREVFVDTEHGINTAIRKIRQVLRDDPEQPRFVQTVTGKGYRFVIGKNDEENGAAKGLESREEQPAPASVQPLPVEGVAAKSSPAEALPASSWAAEAKAAQVQPLSESGARSRSWPNFATAISAIFLLAIALFALNVAGVRDRIFPAKPASQIHSIAVIPLVNLSGDASQDYFADGMTDELITMLAKNTALRVVSRTSVMQYKSAQRPVREIARELGVDGILEGSVVRSANRVHMNVQLVFAPTDTHVWAESYDRDLGQAFLLPSELSQTVAKEVRTAVAHASPPRYINPEAYDAYLKGRYIWNGQNDGDSRQFFEKAIQIQPDYALAWSGLADSYLIRPVDGFCPAKEIMAKGEAAARRAVQLDDSLPDVHVSMAGWYFFYAWDLHRALAEAERAIELNPNYATGHLLREHILIPMNRGEEAIQEQKKYMELEPFVRPWALGYAYIHVRQFDNAIAELRLRAMALPNDASVRFMLSQSYWLKGMWKQSEQELEKTLQLTDRPDAAAAIHKAFEQGGEKAVERWGVEDIKARARKGYVSPFDIASQYAYLGDKDHVLKFLEDAYEEHSPSLIFLQNEPIFDFLHAEPRYRELVKKMGLPPAY